ncbi:hypothetical protein DPEC_G00159290 [Dallia pectoralis]|uniref:Uncharacterized protein n=1 Tax=Dallia pectoralis TaxID=75939 RepID=A0ACC2GFF6_DALPE|nr:hypothetical protein DPEC_G00159290 [Dallia pectoralis]
MASVVDLVSWSNSGRTGRPNGFLDNTTPTSTPPPTGPLMVQPHTLIEEQSNMTSLIKHPIMPEMTEWVLLYFSKEKNLMFFLLEDTTKFN